MINQDIFNEEVSNIINIYDIYNLYEKEVLVIKRFIFLISILLLIIRFYKLSVLAWVIVSLLVIEIICNYIYKRREFYKRLINIKDINIKELFLVEINHISVKELSFDEINESRNILASKLEGELFLIIRDNLLNRVQMYFLNRRMNILLKDNDNKIKFKYAFILENYRYLIIEIKNEKNDPNTKLIHLF